MKIHISLAVLALTTLSCQSTRLIHTWEPKGFAGAPYERLMIVGLIANPAARSQYENDFVDKLANYRILAIASINVVPKLENIDHETVESWLTEFRLDGVIVTRLTTVKPARHYVPPQVSLGGWYGAWAAESQVISREGKFYLEADLFDARTEELLYSAALQTKIKKGDRTKTIHAVIDRLAADMQKRGYLRGS